MANLVREWLTVAEPPENAVQGVNFRYDEFGRKVGTGATVRTIRTHDTVDYGSGTSPEARVWSEFRTALDSIDHCILEEYVVARLQEQGIDHCRGRYGAVRDLAGVPLAEARGEVEGAGFTVGPPTPGTAAPTPEASGTVERQEPNPAQHLRRGQEVTLVVHTPHIPSTLFAPDLVDMKLREATDRLQELGLERGLEVGTAATTPAESELIEAQQPAAGSPVEPGGKVVLRFRPAYVATSTLPNVVGMSPRAAKAALIAVGIDEEAIKVRGGPSAPSAELAGTVMTQEPAAGWAVDSGGDVTLIAHSGFVDARTVPSVAGMTEAAARQSLAAEGLQMRRTDGPAAQSQGASGTVIEQSPAAGSTVIAGSAVEISVYTAYVPPPAPPRPTPPGPGPPTPAPPTPIRETGLPPFQCPASVALTSNSRQGLRGFPIGTQFPLNPANSGFKNQNRVFVCGYRRDNINLTFVHVHWSPLSGVSFPQSGVCGEDSTNMLGTRYVFSRRYVASVWVFNSGLDFDFGLRMARQFFSQLEGYAKLCPGAAPATGRQTRPPAPPQPPPVPPACPGPEAPPAYTLHFFGEPHVNICGNRSGKMWINVSNNIHPIDSIRRGAADPDGKCWSGTQVVTPGHTYTGRLCQ